jgi:hypothetical protein
VHRQASVCGQDGERFALYFKTLAGVPHRIECHASETYEVVMERLEEASFRSMLLVDTVPD